MVCKFCRKAGLLNAEANKASNPADARRIYKNARAWHKKCKGCDCHHRTGICVNPNGK